MKWSVCVNGKLVMVNCGMRQIELVQGKRVKASNNNNRTKKAKRTQMVRPQLVNNTRNIL
ncbi:hypothetical protein RDWZM_004181, partial [Blomia tropicalis]